jgi:cell division protein FtsW (lipid II flippase)
VSLKHVHVLLISLSVLLLVLFGGYSLHAWSAEGGGADLALGLFSLVLAGGLAVYVGWFVRKVRTREEDDRRRRKLIQPLAVALVVFRLASRPALACAVCYGEASGPMIDAARLGVWLLFGLVGAVQLAFVVFFIQLWRRSRGR